jgi:hypothetical protein
VENSMAAPQKPQNTTTTQSSIPTIRYSEGIKSVCGKDIVSTTFILSIFTVAKMWNQPKGLSTNEWIKKMWHIHAMKLFSAFKTMKFYHL